MLSKKNKSLMSYFLPKVDLPFNYDHYTLKSFLFYTSEIDNQSYHDLIQLIQEFVLADCWALTVDNKVVYKKYQCQSEDLRNKSIRKEILEGMIRTQIISDPHKTLLIHLLRCDKRSRIRFYMGYSLPWTMNIDYKPEHRVFQVSFSQSQEYYDYFNKI